MVPFSVSEFCFECGGQVSYEVHTVNTSMSILSQVDDFINQNQQREFHGQWLIVATWEDIPLNESIKVTIKQMGRETL